MYTEVFVVGEFDDLPTPTFRQRPPAAPICVPVAEPLAVTTESTIAADDTPIATTAITLPAADDSPDLGFAPLPPITNFSSLRTANVSYLDDDCRSDAVHVAPIHAASPIDDTGFVGTRYIASNPSPSDPSCPDDSLCLDSALRTKHSALSSVACFCLIPPDNCLFPSAQDGSLSREFEPVTFSPVRSGKTGKHDTPTFCISHRVYPTPRLSPAGTSLVQPDASALGILFATNHLGLPTHKKALLLLTKGLTEYPSQPTTMIPSISTNGITSRIISPTAKPAPLPVPSSTPHSHADTAFYSALRTKHSESVLKGQ